MSRLGTTDKKEDALVRKFAELGIREEDLEEKFIRASGPGGQNVNKVSTCVVLKHIPSGVSVRVQKERTQALNRFHARRELATKIENAKLGRQSEQRKKIEKIRRQKRKRSRRAKAKMLDDKTKQGKKKSLRKKVTEDDD
ncbi:MAG: peptide chain release factor-like protein [Candidatus Lindowbacteria bacterium]|nr:peptide chain release factor-like protein [Candidatus Lindowbacteria bacterium]